MMHGLPKILHVVRRLGHGGLETGVVSVIGGLERLGFEQAVCCLEDRGELGDRLPRSVPLWSCIESGRPQRIPRRAAQYIRSWRPDVIHARNTGAWIDAVAAWFLAGCIGRLAFSFHGWSRLDPMPWRQALLLRQLARVTPALAAVSAEAAAQFALETGIPTNSFVVLSSGVDTDRFHPAPVLRPPGRIVLGCVARLDPVKAHEVLIEAFDLARDSGKRDLELNLLGDGPCRPALEQSVRERNLGDYVRFLGMSDDVPKRLRELDLFVLSSHREGRPTSIMEAMASGLPVIATRVGSMPKLVAHEQTGLVVDPGDVGGLARAIGVMADNRDLRLQFGERARQVAVDELSIRSMVDQYATFYRSMVPTRSMES